MSDKYKCAMCDLREDLWLCLICAHIGCGRHENKHAEHHFYETGHTFAMKIGNNLVWDYAADAHVHRLVANTSDGKPVEVDSEDADDKKLSTICMEYTALLADQLSSQRAYLESEFCVRLSMVEHQLERQMQLQKDGEEQYRTVVKEKLHLEKRCNQVNASLQKLQKEHEEEAIMNKALMERQIHLNKALKSKDEELVNLQEQLTDLMMNLQMGSRIAEAQSRGEVSARVPCFICFLSLSFLSIA